MAENECYTYFIIKGRFNPDEITKILGITPDRVKVMGDICRNGSKADEASWECGLCNEYDPLVEKQMERTIERLIGKEELLNQIRERTGAKLYLSVVPTVYAGGVNPCLAPSLKVIDFCHATRTEIDIDLYVI
ncbi:MAG: DUF4279 domain-containing protein [Clostridia bacterium]|nr:DUF4279 domain-containing protein [Clostridia bacterium]